MELVNMPSKPVRLIRWPINGFIHHARDIRTGLDSEHFSLNGLTSKFYLCVYPSDSINGHLHYYLYMTDIGSEKEIEFKCRFWLENVDSEKYVFLLLKTFIFFSTNTKSH
jgi:hypothetical protein